MSTLSNMVVLVGGAGGGAWADCATRPDSPLIRLPAQEVGCGNIHTVHVTTKQKFLVILDH